MNTKIKGIIFDYGGVISRPQREEKVALIMETLSITDREAFNRVYYSIRREYDLGASGAAYWANFTRAFGLPCPQKLAEDLITIDTESWIEVNQEVIDYIAQLKLRGFKMGLLSNMPPEILRYMEDHFSWLNHFDQCIFSCDIKMAKPDMAIYRHCVTQLNLKPEECVFIDDTEANVIGAEQFGIQAIRFENVEKLKEVLESYLV